MLNKTQNKIFKYLKLDPIKNISKGNEFFIKFFFPESKVYIDNFPSFFNPDEDVIFLIDTKKDKGKEILVKMYSNVVLLSVSQRNTIDSKKGFLTILTDVLGYNIKDVILKDLQKQSDEDYWLILKTWYSIGEVLEFDTGSSSDGNTFNLFKCLFSSDFGTLYSLYKESGEPYQKVFSTILTMMFKAKNPNLHNNISPYYKQILEKNNKYLPMYKKALYNYTQGNVSEIDFMKFLYECSNSFSDKFKTN